VKSININTTDSGTLTLDLDADTITVDSTNPTTINIEGIHLIDAISITSSSLLTLDTNSVEIGSLTLFVTNNNTVITTAAPLISLTSTLSANSTVTYTGLSAIDISLIGVGNGLVTVQNSNEISIDGDMVNMEIVGNLLDTITTDNLNVSTKYTMNNTLVNSLQFASTALLNSVSEIEVNTLSNTVIEDIINTLSGLTITLYSPLTDTDLYNYYYVTEYDSLVAQEALDSVRYDALRNTAVNDSWTEVSGNQYMDYLDETTTKQAIADNTLLSIEQYFQNYLTNEGTDEPTLGEPASTTARNAIQVTLDQIDSIMDDTALQNAVISGMETDADTLAIADQGTTTFTIG